MPTLMCFILELYVLTKKLLCISLNTEQFKKGDIFFNYGCLPRTWEDPTFVHPDAEGCRGDNDPVDVCEIGARIVKTGVSLYLHAFQDLACLNNFSYILLWPMFMFMYRKSAPQKSLVFSV